MDLDFVERLIGLVERYGVAELDYAAEGIKVRIARQRGAEPKREGAVGALATVSAERTVDPPPGPAAPPEHLVCAGMLGTFFRAPGPGQAPFVSEGDIVAEGQTLGILEAMKMLNPVEADRSGRILRILVEDGVSVSAGTTLFAIAASE